MIHWFWLIFLPFASSGKLTSEENARLAKTCGLAYRRVQAKVFPMDKLTNDEYPFMAAISTDASRCTGSLISPRHILTAAHCVTDGSNPNVTGTKCPERKLRLLSKFLYYLGGNKCIPSKEKCKEKRAYKVHYHEQYDYCSAENDIAIIELDEDVPDSEATPICLPTRNEAIKTDLIAVGAGARGPNPKDESEKPIGLQKLNVQFLQTRNKVIDVIMPQTAGICPGDSGGALIQTNSDNKIIQLGVMSYGSTCKEHFPYSKISNFLIPHKVDSDAADTFTDVRQYLDWICEKTGVCQGDNGFNQGDYPSYQWDLQPLLIPDLSRRG